MSTADTIASFALGVAVVIGLGQTCLLTWYAWETRKLRKDAAAQNELIAGQLTTMQASLQQAISKEEREADLHILWGDGVTNPNVRQIIGTNFGGDIQLLETRCSRIDVHFNVPSKVWPTGSHFRWTFNFGANIRVYYSIKYVTKQKQEKEKVFELPPDSASPFEVSHVQSNTLQLVKSYL